MKKGFTLSEVLITLGIIGIIAVLTIPGLMKNYSNRIYVSELQKAYALVSEAVQNIMNDEHTDNFQRTSASAKNPAGCPGDMTKCTEGPMYFLMNYFKTMKTKCGPEGDSTCAKNNLYKNLNNEPVNTLGTTHGCVQTVSGMTLCGGYNPSNKCLSMGIDVNGLNQPNVAGRDIFSIDIHKDGSITDWGSCCEDNNTGAPGNRCGLGNTSSAVQAAAGCLNNVLEAGWKMEY